MKLEFVFIEDFSRNFLMDKNPTKKEKKTKKPRLSVFRPRKNFVFRNHAWRDRHQRSTDTPAG